MGKDKRHNIYKQVYRDLLKSEGHVHLPSNKAHTPKNAYKRKKMALQDIQYGEFCDD